MFVDKYFRDIVGYLGVDDGFPSPKPVATVFFVNFSDGTSSGIYAVTARHCIDVRDRYLYIQRRGDRDDIATEPHQWILHPSNDLAVCPIEHGVYLGATYGLFADKQPNPYFVRSGHEVFTVGLFSRLPGRSAVEPIVRFGHVALSLADAEIVLDPISKPNITTAVHARLIETRSWGGESGSPVFIHSPYYQPSSVPPPKDQANLGVSTPATPVRSVSLLGVLHGHYQIDQPIQMSDGFLDVNAGIAVVVQVEVLRRFLLTNERLIEHRENAPQGLL